MKKVKITVMKTACYKDLIDKYLLQTVGKSRKNFVKALGKAYPLMLWRLLTAARTFMTGG